MKHLHFQFIAASCGFGFGLFMLILTAWQAQALSLGAAPTLRAASPIIDLFVGLVLVAFGWHGIRREVASLRAR